MIATAMATMTAYLTSASISLPYRLLGDIAVPQSKAGAQMRAEGDDEVQDRSMKFLGDFVAEMG